MNEIPDHLNSDLRVLFVGYNPGNRSSQVRHHYAGHSNQFWRLLWEAGLTERQYRAEEDGLLLQAGYGFTNLVARPSGSSSELTPTEMAAGATLLREKIAHCRPRLVCFLGKEVYRRYANRKSTEPITYGRVREGTLNHGIAEFVAPNPSGRSTVPYAEKLAAFGQLQDYLKTL